jgi:hypothetical protein
MTTHQSRSVIDGECLELSSREDMAIEFVQVAGTTALIVDNVYKDPDYVRGLALSLSYHRRAGAYPGYFAFMSVSATPFLDLVNTLMRDVVGDYLTFTFPYKDDLVFAIITERGTDLSPTQRRPHMDDFCDYAGLVYLNPPGQCSGGTSFWRHRLTGMQVAPDAPQPGDLSPNALVPSGPDVGDSIGYLTESTETWELTQVLPARYNRFVLYKSKIFHSPHYNERDFGSALAERRLTQNLYLDKWHIKNVAKAAGRQSFGHFAVDTSGPSR